MAEFHNFSAEQNTAQTTTSSTYSTISGTTISGSSLKANTKYLIMCRALHSSHDTTDHGYLRVYTADDTDVVDQSEVRYEYNQTNTSVYSSYQFFRSYTTDSSPSDVYLESKVLGGATMSVTNITLVLLDLDFFGADNYEEDFLASGTSTLGTSYTTYLEIPAVDLWDNEDTICLGYQRFQVGSTRDMVRATMQNGGYTRTAVEEGEDTNELRMYGMVVANKPTVATNPIMGAYVDGGTWYIKGGYMIALKGSRFTDVTWVYDASSSSGAAIVADTVDYTPSLAGNHLIFGQAQGSTSTIYEDSVMWMEEDDTEFPSNDSTYSQTQTWDAADGGLYNTFAKKNVTKTLHTYDLMVGPGQAGSDYFYVIQIIIINLAVPPFLESYSDIVVSGTENTFVQNSSDVVLLDERGVLYRAPAVTPRANDYYGGAKYLAGSGDDIWLIAPEMSATNTYSPFFIWKTGDWGPGYFYLANETSPLDYVSSDTNQYDIDMVYDGSTYLYIFLYRVQPAPDQIHAIKYNTTTDAYVSSTTASWDPVQHASMSYSRKIIAAYKSSTEIGIVCSDTAAENYSSFFPFNPTTMAFGTRVDLDATDHVAVWIDVDSGGDFHMLTQTASSSSPWEVNHWEVSGTTATGPHDILPDADEGGYYYTNNPKIWAFNVDGTDTLFCGYTDDTANAFKLRSSTNSGVTWSTEFSLSELNSNDHACDMFIMDNDTLVFVYHQSAVTPDSDSLEYEKRKTVSGSWSDPVNIGSNDVRSGIDVIPYDTTYGYYLYVTQSYNDGFAVYSRDEALTLNKKHTSDIRVSLPGAVNGMYLPSTSVGNPTTIGRPFVQWGVAEENKKQLIGRIWTNNNPKATGYNYQVVETFDFNEDIAWIECEPSQEWVAVQLTDGSVHLGKYTLLRSYYSYASQYYYINEWDRDQDTYTNGPNIQPREIAPACTTAPETFGVRFDRLRNCYAFNWEPVGGVEKVWWTELVRDNDGTWGYADTTSPTQIDSMWAHPPQMIDPENTTDDERIVDIPFSVYEYGAPNGQDVKQFPVLYTKEGATQTYLYQRYVNHVDLYPMWSTATSGTFTLNHPDRNSQSTSGSIDYNETASSLKTILEAMTEITTANVTGSGTKADPWMINVTVIASDSGECVNYFYTVTDTLNGTGLVIGTMPDAIQIMEIKHQTIPRLLRRNTAGHKQDSITDQGYERIIWYAQTNGKLGAYITVTDKVLGTYWFYGEDILWTKYAEDATTGNVHVDDNGYVAVVGYASGYPRLYNEDDDAYFYQWDHVLAIDATTQDIVLCKRQTLWNRDLN